MKEKSPIEVAIRADWHKCGMTMTDVAQKVGVTSQNLQNIMSRPLSVKNAVKLASVFGYSVEYLTTGEGSLFPDQSAPAAPSRSGVVLPSELVQMFNNMTDTIALQQRNIAQLIDHLGATATAAAPMKKSSPADWRG